MLTRTRRRLLVLVLAGAMAVTGSVTATTQARAATALAVTSAPATVLSAADYATEYLSDAWDYSNPEDQNLSDRSAMLNVTNQQVSGGRLSFQATAGSSYVSPVWAGFPGEQPSGRSGLSIPVDSGRYTRFAVRMRLSTAQGSAALFWSSCQNMAAPCQGAKAFNFGPAGAWQTYDFSISPDNPYGPGVAQQAWQGQIVGVRLAFGMPAGTNVDIDWIRIYQPTPSTTRTITFSDPSPARAATVYWDVDASQANNTPDNPTWGVLGTVASTTSTGNAVTFDAAAFPPSGYTFYVVAGSTASASGGDVLVNNPPQPVIESPGPSSGPDYAAANRNGDRWDFASASDITQIGNVSTWSTASGHLEATNGPPQRNDPFVRPAMAGPINGSIYHHLTVVTGYDGPFGLEDAPGGGQVARLQWRVAGSSSWDQTRPIVVYDHGVQTLSVDLATNPPSAIDDTSSGATIHGWAGQQIVDVRFDPNEDPGARHWRVYSMSLTADDTAATSYDVKFHDNAWKPGNVADIFVGLLPGVPGPKLVGSIAVQPGQNTFRLDASALAPGSYWVTVIERDAVQSHTVVAKVPLRITGSSFDAYAGFSQGGFVAAGDLGNGRSIVTGADAGGGALVRTFSADGNPGPGWLAYPLGFAGGVRVAVCHNLAGIGPAVVTGAGPGGGPHVRVFRPDGTPVGGFFAYPAGFSGGVYVGCADVDPTQPGDEIITGAGAGGGPHVRIFTPDATPVGGFFAFASGFAGGVRVAAGNVSSAQAGDEVIVGAGPGGGPHVRVMTASGSELGGFFAFPSGFAGGVFVGQVDLDGNGQADVVVGADSIPGAHVIVRRVDGSIVGSAFPYPAAIGARVAGGRLGPGAAETIVTASGPGVPVVVSRFTVLL